MNTRVEGGRRGGEVRWTRRGLLLAAAAAGGSGLAACSVGTATTAPATNTVTTTGQPEPAPTVTVTDEAPAPEPSGTRPPPAQLPERPEPFEVIAGEVLPACKQAAADFLLAAMSFDDRGRDDDALTERLAAVQGSFDVARPLLGLLPANGPGALRIQYVQYSGLSPAEDRAAQIVIGDQLLLDAEGALVRRPFGADVRLSLQDDRWIVTSAVPAYPDPPLPPLPDAIQALLESDRVDLPGLAVADLRSGVVHESVATCLLTLAEQWQIRVHDFYSAHPVNVFPTTRTSSHTVGRAVDVTALDDIPIIRQDTAPWEAFMQAAREAGSVDIGGPVELEPAASFFTDRVHQDHVHLSFPLPADRRI